MDADIQTLSEAEILISDIIQRVVKLKRMPDEKLLLNRNSDLAVVYSQLMEIKSVLQHKVASK
jgi:hypothetical protein